MIISDYLRHREISVEGRYVTSQMLEQSWLAKLETTPVRTVGTSVNGKDIKAVTLGTGSHKVLMWSQMHGNESTTTKAVMDMVNFLRSQEGMAQSILKACTLCIVPILNPDGAEKYTRVNANEVDLNRDAKNLSQPESKVLRELFEQFNPDFCFNLHDQRTLFSAGSMAKPATVSFLSPANNKERTVDSVRTTAMKLIAAMAKVLNESIPDQIGRYDDAFNENCVGDAFQMLGVPTILFEAGHFPGDYQREQTRSYIFMALLTALNTIVQNRLDEFGAEDYFGIPENAKLFYDILIVNAYVVNPSFTKEDKIGIRFVEELEGEGIVFKPEVADIGQLIGCYGHEILDCSNQHDLNSLNSRKLLPLMHRDKK